MPQCRVLSPQVADLKLLLEEMGLSTAGKKAELIERLEESAKKPAKSKKRKARAAAEEAEEMEEDPEGEDEDAPEEVIHCIDCRPLWCS